MCKHIYTHTACGHVKVEEDQCDMATGIFSTLFCDDYTTERISSLDLCSVDRQYCKETAHGQSIRAAFTPIKTLKERLCLIKERIHFLQERCRHSQEGLQSCGAPHTNILLRDIQNMTNDISQLQAVYKQTQIQGQKLIGEIPAMRAYYASQSHPAQADSSPYIRTSIGSPGIDGHDMSTMLQKSAISAAMGHGNLSTEATVIRDNITQHDNGSSRQTTVFKPRFNPKLLPAFTSPEKMSTPLKRQHSTLSNLLYSTGHETCSQMSGSRTKLSCSVKTPASRQSSPLGVRRSGRNRKKVSYAEPSPSTSQSTEDMIDVEWSAQETRDDQGVVGFGHTDNVGPKAKRNRGEVDDDEFQAEDADERDSDVSTLSNIDAMSTPSDITNSLPQKRSRGRSESRDGSPVKPARRFRLRLSNKRQTRQESPIDVALNNGGDDSMMSTGQRAQLEGIDSLRRKWELPGAGGRTVSSAEPSFHGPIPPIPETNSMSPLSNSLPPSMYLRGGDGNTMRDSAACGTHTLPQRVVTRSIIKLQEAAGTSFHDITVPPFQMQDAQLRTGTFMERLGHLVNLSESSSFQPSGYGHDNRLQPMPSASTFYTNAHDGDPIDYDIAAQHQIPAMNPAPTNDHALRVQQYESQSPVPIPQMTVSTRKHLPPQIPVICDARKSSYADGDVFGDFSAEDFVNMSAIEGDDFVFTHDRS